MYCVIPDLVAFAQEISELGPTSPFTLVIQAMNEFAAMVNTDMSQTFGDTDYYVYIYEKAYHRRQMAVLGWLIRLLATTVFSLLGLRLS